MENMLVQNRAVLEILSTSVVVRLLTHPNSLPEEIHCRVGHRNVKN